MLWAGWSVCTARRPGRSTRAPGWRRTRRWRRGSPPRSSPTAWQHSPWERWTSQVCVCVCSVLAFAFHFCAFTPPLPPPSRGGGGRQSGCEWRHGQQGGHVPAGHRGQAPRRSLLRGSAEHVLRPEPGERQGHHHWSAPPWGTDEYKWSSHRRARWACAAWASKREARTLWCHSSCAETVFLCVAFHLDAFLWFGYLIIGYMIWNGWEVICLDEGF